MLTRRKKLFAEHFHLTQNGTKSALYARYSEKTAYSQACRLLKDVDITKRLEELKTEEKKRMGFENKEAYVTQTFKHFESAKHESAKTRYWEMLGNCLQYLRPNQQTTIISYADSNYFTAQQNRLSKNSSITKARLNDPQTIDTKPLTISNTVQPDRHPDDKSNAHTPDDTPDDKPVNSNQSISKEV